MEMTQGDWWLREVKEHSAGETGMIAEVNFLEFTNEYQIVAADNITVVAVMGTEWASGSALANARLLVQAPKLLKWLEFFTSMVSLMDTLPADYQQEIRELFIAIKKGGENECIKSP